MLTAEGNARSRNLLRRFGNVVEFPLQYLVVIIKSITYLSFRFLWNILHVLNHFGSVYGDDDVRLKNKTFCRVKVVLAWGDFHARSRIGRSTIPEEKWVTTPSLGSRLACSAGVFWAGESCLFMFVLLQTAFLSWRRKIRECKYSNPKGRCWGEKRN